MSGHYRDQTDASADPIAHGRGQGEPRSVGVEARLLDGLRQRSQEALTMVVERYSLMLTKAAWLYLADAHAAEDAVQETFLAAWDAAKRTTDHTCLRAWLFGILANHCRKHVRAATRRRRRERLVAANRPVLAEADAAALRLEALQKALGRLGDEHREVVILRFWQGLSVEETAAALGVPPGTVKSRCHAAIARLRHMLEARR